jgi:hypothetical protein
MLEDRKKPTDHRQGVLVKILDLVQRFSVMYHEDDFYDIEEGQINKKYQEELEDMMRELRKFDVTEIGNLYLTSGGRIVLDKGYGEYFTDGDKVIFTLNQLTSGMPCKKFKKRIDEFVK